MHGFAKTHPLADGLASVRKYLQNGRDILIWDGGYHGFGLDEKPWPEGVHEEYQALLHEAFDEWWVKPTGNGYDMTLDEIWEQEGLNSGQGRIFITYGVCPGT